VSFLIRSLLSCRRDAARARHGRTRGLGCAIGAKRAGGGFDFGQRGKNIAPHPALAGAARPCRQGRGQARQLAYARAVFKVAVGEKPAGRFMIRSRPRVVKRNPDGDWWEPPSPLHPNLG
jgi:hypothetical protein